MAPGIGSGVNEGTEWAREMGVPTGGRKDEGEQEQWLADRSMAHAFQQAASEAQGIPEKEKKLANAEAERREKFIKAYEEGAPEFAENQRKLLGLDAEQFLVLKGYLPGERVSMSTVISNYAKKEPLKARLQREDMGMSTADWMAFNGMIPLKQDRGTMVESYQRKEPEAVLLKRQALGMTAEQFLDHMGILPEPDEAEAWYVADGDETLHAEFEEHASRAYDKANNGPIVTIAP